MLGHDSIARSWWQRNPPRDDADDIGSSASQLGLESPPTGVVDDPAFRHRQRVCSAGSADLRRDVGSAARRERPARSADVAQALVERGARSSLRPSSESSTHPGQPRRHPPRCRAADRSELVLDRLERFKGIGAAALLPAPPRLDACRELGRSTHEVVDAVTKGALVLEATQRRERSLRDCAEFARVEQSPLVERRREQLLLGAEPRPPRRRFGAAEMRRRAKRSRDLGLARLPQPADPRSGQVIDEAGERLWTADEPTVPNEDRGTGVDPRSAWTQYTSQSASATAIVIP